MLIYLQSDKHVYVHQLTPRLNQNERDARISETTRVPSTLVRIQDLGGGHGRRIQDTASGKMQHSRRPPLPPCYHPTRLSGRLPRGRES